MKPRLMVSAFVSLTLAAALAASAQIVPLGPPFQVNRNPVLLGSSLSAASDAAGRFVAVWTSDSSLYYRLFDGQGHPRGVLEGQVGATSDYPDVTVNAAGRSAVAWTENGESISFRRFREDGVALGGIIEVSGRRSGFQGPPAIAGLESSGYVVVWPSVEPAPWGVDILARRFDRLGRPLGPVARVNRIRRLPQTAPDVAALPDGGFAVVWETDDIGGIPTRGIFMRIFDRNGRPRGDEVRVDSGASDVQLRPKVAVARSAGEIAVVWEARDTSGLGIFLRRFDAGGQPFGGELQVNSVEAFQQSSPSVAIDPRGNFVVAWSSQTALGSPANEVRARWFDNGATPVGEDFQVDPRPGFLPAATMDDAGNFAILWTAPENVLGSRILARRYAAQCPLGPAVFLGRFQAEACWLDPGRGRGSESLTTEAGAFWNFSFGLPDLTFRVLDGRTANGHFWIYGTSLTSYQTVVRITDTETGEQNAYLSRPGEFATFRDLEALPAEDFAPGPPPVPAAGDDGALFLLGGRFEVSATWRDTRGQLVTATAVPLSSNAGYLRFFGLGEPAVVVKILDGRAVNGSAWVFLGGLSDVEYTVTVVDQDTGRSKIYFNAAGQLRNQIDLMSFPL